MIYSSHSIDVLNTTGSDAAQEPVAKRLKTEDVPEKKNQPNIPPPSKAPLPVLERLESNPVDSFVPPGADANKCRVTIKKLDDRGYAAVDISHGGKAAFTDPFKKHMTNKPIQAAEALGFRDIVFACVDGDPRTCKKGDPTLNRFVPYTLFIVHQKEGETLEDVRNKTVTLLTQYANTHIGEGEENFRYKPEYCPGLIENSNLEHPWNHYVQNKSVCRFMKRCYEGVPKERIMRDEKALVRFFGSTEEGSNILALMDWDKL